tara:strand:+ start:2436 stop:2546 length:111 start_codon:yes stop_codon:yes gene_type:complete
MAARNTIREIIEGADASVSKDPAFEELLKHVDALTE